MAAVGFSAVQTLWRAPLKEFAVLLGKTFELQSATVGWWFIEGLWVTFYLFGVGVSLLFWSSWVLVVVWFVQRCSHVVGMHCWSDGINCQERLV